MLNFILAAALALNFAPQTTIAPQITVAQEPQNEPIIQITSIELKPCKGGTMPYSTSGTAVVMFPPRYNSVSYTFTSDCNGGVHVAPANVGDPELDPELVQLLLYAIIAEF